MSSGAFIGLGHDGAEDVVERVVALRGAVLDLQLEAAGRADAEDGRRVKNENERILNSRVLPLQPLDDGVGFLVRAHALLERLERDEDDACAGGVGEAVDRETGERDGRLDIGILQRDGAHRADDGLGAVERGALRQLREADEILLVLRRHEAGRHDVEEIHRGADEAGVEDQQCMDLVAE